MAFKFSQRSALDVVTEILNEARCLSKTVVGNRELAALVLKALTPPAVAELTMDGADALFKEMSDGYAQELLENDHVLPTRIEHSYIRSFFDFIEQKGYLKAVAAQGVTETMTVKQFIDQIGGAFCPCDNDPRSHGDVLFRRYPNGVTILPDKAATAPNSCADKGE